MRNKILLFFSLLYGVVVAQPPTKFYTTLGGSGEDVGYSAKQTNDGQYIIVGSTTSFGSLSTDVYLIKLDTMGFTIWQKIIGGQGIEVGKSIIQLPDSGFVIAGFTSSYGALGGYDAYLLRTDKNGNELWHRLFGGAGWDFANDLVRASDGNIVVTGLTYSFGNGKKDGFVAKYDLSGNLVWQKIIGGAEDDELNSIIRTVDNKIATVGYTGSGGDVNGDLYFLKLDLNGDTLFTKRFGGVYKDFATDVIQKISGDYFICGAKTFTAGEKTRSYLLGINAAGSFKWDNSYYASNNADENYVSLADAKTTQDLAAYLRNVPVSAFKIQGNIMTATPGGWAQDVNSFGGNDDEEFFSLESTRDRGFISVGSTASFGSNYKDIFFMKQDSGVINYSSLVNVKQQEKNDSRVLVKSYGNKKFAVQTDEALKINTACIINLEGRVIKEYVLKDESFTFDAVDLNDSVFILRLIGENGYISHQKLICR